MIGYGLKSGTDQSMLTRELQLYKARFGAKNAILSLVFRGDNVVAPSQVHFSYTMPKAMEKSSAEPEEEVIKIEDEYPEVDTRGHGVVNPVEA